MKEMKTVTKVATVGYSCNDVIEKGTKVNVIEEDIKMSLVEIDGVSYYVESSKLIRIKDDNNRSTLVNLLKQQIGKPYLWGAEGPDSFDCSGLAQYVYKVIYGVTLPRVSRNMATTGKKVVNVVELKPGDLIFFDTTGDGIVNHVGIYIGEGKMIHASSSGTVREGKLESPYWLKKIIVMRNLIDEWYK